MLPKWITAPKVSSRAPRKRFALLVEPLEERSLFATNVLAGGTLPPQFVTSLYTQLLHRQPQSAETESWSLALDNGANTSEVARGFVDSIEYQSAEVTQGYQKYLHRNPEAGAVNNWVSQMQSGLSDQQFTNIVLSSSEYINDHGGTAAGYATGLYQDVLGRAPDAGGLGNWVNALSSGTTPAQVAPSFVFSAENLGNQLTADYQKLLGRSPDAGGYAFWLNEMEHGLSLEQVTVNFFGSNEFTAGQNSVTAPTGPGGITTGAASSLKLVVTSFSSSSNPTVSVDVNPGNYSGPAFIDVDLQHDGRFTDAGDTGQTSGSISPQSHTLNLSTLANGTYSIRARVFGMQGQSINSPTATITVNTNEGPVIGANDLLNLYNDSNHDYVTMGALPANFFKIHLENFAFGGVGIHVHATLPQYLNNLAADLINLGAADVQSYPSQQMVNGFIPVWMIPQLTSLPNFASVSSIERPLSYLGSAETQGDGVMLAPQFRATQGADGSGQIVGVLSTSANNVTGGLGQSERTGDLIPSHVKDLEDLPAGDPNATDEGRAMMEIVADVAPGSNQYFHTGFISEQDMASGILQLAGAGASSIVDDINYGDEPMFNDGIIGQAVNQVNSQGVFYASAAGNAGPMGFTTSWNSINATVAGINGTFLDLGNQNVFQTFTLLPGQTFSPDVQWDNAFLEGGASSSNPNFQVQTQINVLITNGAGTVVEEGTAGAPFGDQNNTIVGQGGTNQAFQQIGFQNTTTNVQQYAMEFQLVQGPAPTKLRWVDFQDYDGVDIGALGEGGPVVFGHQTAAGDVAVAAAFWGTPKVTENFSSVGGPVPFLFDASGNRLATPDIRQKPNLTAPDGVDVSFAFGFPPAAGSPDPHFNFFGTSAASPHVAGAAALLLQRYGKTSPSQLLQYMEQTATPVDGTVPNQFAGSGLVQLVAQSGITGGLPFVGGQTSNTATQMGILTGTQNFSGTISRLPNDLPSNQWGEWTAGASGTFSATINYGLINGDLNMRLYTLDAAGDLILLASATNLSALSQHLSAPVTAGEPLLLWIYGYNHAQGSFGLSVSIQ
jgi:hypothetical protein